jgi:hypothetical protein
MSDRALAVLLIAMTVAPVASVTAPPTLSSASAKISGKAQYAVDNGSQHHHPRNSSRGVSDLAVDEQGNLDMERKILTSSAM